MFVVNNIVMTAEVRENVSLYICNNKSHTQYLFLVCNLDLLFVIYANLASTGES